MAFNDQGQGENRELSGHQLGLAHFAYVTSDLEGIIQRLESAGFNISSDGNHTKYRKNIYFLDPNGYEVEFVQYHTDDSRLRNNY